MYLPYSLYRNIHSLCYFFRFGLPSQFLKELPGYPYLFIYGFNHVNRNTYCSGLVGNGSCNSLPDPPCSISGELIPLSVIKFFHCLYEAHVSFLNKIEKMHTTPHITLSYTHHQTKIGLCQPVLCRHIPFFHLLSVHYLLFSRKKVNLTDFFKIHTYGVIRTYSLRHGNIYLSYINLIIIVVQNGVFIIIENVQIVQIVQIIQFFYFVQFVGKIYFDSVFLKNLYSLFKIICPVIGTSQELRNIFHLDNIFIFLGDGYKI